MQSYKNGSNTDNIVPHRTLGGNRIGQSQYCRPFYKVMLDKPRKVGGIRYQHHLCEDTNVNQMVPYSTSSTKSLKRDVNDGKKFG